MAHHPVFTSQRHDHALPGHTGRDRDDPELFGAVHVRLGEAREVPGAVGHHRRLPGFEPARGGWGLGPAEAGLGRRAVCDELLSQA